MNEGKIISLLPHLRTERVVTSKKVDIFRYRNEQIEGTVFSWKPGRFLEAYLFSGKELQVQNPDQLFPNVTAADVYRLYLLSDRHSRSIAPPIDVLKLTYTDDGEIVSYDVRFRNDYPARTLLRHEYVFLPNNRVDLMCGKINLASFPREIVPASLLRDESFDPQTLPDLISVYVAGTF